MNHERIINMKKSTCKKNYRQTNHMSGNSENTHVRISAQRRITGAKQSSNLPQLFANKRLSIRVMIN